MKTKNPFTQSVLRDVAAAGLIQSEKPDGFLNIVVEPYDRARASHDNEYASEVWANIFAKEIYKVWKHTKKTLLAPIGVGISRFSDDHTYPTVFKVFMLIFTLIGMVQVVKLAVDVTVLYIRWSISLIDFGFMNTATNWVYNFAVNFYVDSGIRYEDATGAAAIVVGMMTLAFAYSVIRGILIMFANAIAFAAHIAERLSSPAWRNHVNPSTSKLAVEIGYTMCQECCTVKPNSQIFCENCGTCLVSDN